MPACGLLKTFANSLELDQDRQNIDPDLDPSCFTTIVLMKDFWKKLILKKISRRQPSMQSEPYFNREKLHQSMRPSQGFWEQGENNIHFMGTNTKLGNREHKKTNFGGTGEQANLFQGNRRTGTPSECLIYVSGYNFISFINNKAHGLI